MALLQRNPRRLPRGPEILALAAAGNIALVAAALSLEGATEEGIRLVVRHTAKGALLFFVAAFSASSLQTLWPSAASRYALKNRRWLGLSFALTHLVHLGALVALGIAYPDPFVGGLSPVTLVGGGIAYLFLVLMAATSWNGAVRRLGPTRWRLLHTVGSWYIWLIFFQSYLGRAVSDPFYVPFAGLLVACAGVRATRWVGARRRAGSAAPA
jgi:DMSO/TMAO reductase YedYZ heme-binding membrane subunit